MILRSLNNCPAALLPRFDVQVAERHLQRSEVKSLLFMLWNAKRKNHVFDTSLYAELAFARFHLNLLI